MRIENVREWLLKTCSERELPPIFSFERPRTFEEAETASFLERGLRPSRQNLSGTLEVRVVSTEFALFRDPLSSIVEVAHQEDPRRAILPLQRPHEGSQFLVAHTRVESLPVIGPGGKILIQRSESSLTADITVRRRHLGAIPSENWIEPDAIYRSLLSEFAGYEDAIDIEATLGYFERSKYHVQYLLRPTFLFVIRPRDQGTAESRSVWETTHIVPATWNPAVEPTEQWEIFR
jgi:hypothetical protein